MKFSGRVFAFMFGWSFVIGRIFFNVEKGGWNYFKLESSKFKLNGSTNRHLRPPHTTRQQIRASWFQQVAQSEAEKWLREKFENFSDVLISAT